MSWWESLPGNTCPVIDQAKGRLEAVADDVRDALEELGLCEDDEDGLIDAARSLLGGLSCEIDNAKDLLEEIRDANSRLRDAAEERGKTCEELDADVDRLRAERDRAREERDEARDERDSAWEELESIEAGE